MFNEYQFPATAFHLMQWYGSEESGGDGGESLPELDENVLTSGLNLTISL